MDVHSVFRALTQNHAHRNNPRAQKPPLSRFADVYPHTQVLTQNLAQRKNPRAQEATVIRFMKVHTAQLYNGTNSAGFTLTRFIFNSSSGFIFKLDEQL